MTDALRRWRALVDGAAELQREHDAAFRSVVDAFTTSAVGKGPGPSLADIERCDVLQEQIRRLRADADAVIEAEFGKSGR